jgi:predicted transcriptional regulator
VRITINIDDDVLRAARELARRENKTAGRVISELARQALAASLPAGGEDAKPVHGFRPFPRRGEIVTNEMIDRLREKDAY